MTSICPCEMSERQAGRIQQKSAFNTQKALQLYLELSIDLLLSDDSWYHRNISILILDARCCQFLIFLWRRHWIVAIIVWSCAEIRHMQIANKTQVEPRASFHLNIDGWMSSYCQDAFNYWISCSEIDMVFVFAIH